MVNDVNIFTALQPHRDHSCITLTVFNSNLAFFFTSDISIQVTRLFLEAFVGEFWPCWQYDRFCFIY